MKKLLSILGVSTMLGTSLINLQSIKPSNNILSKNENLVLNNDPNANVVKDDVNLSDSYINNSDTTSLFSTKHNADFIHVFTDQLIFINYGSLGYSNFDAYASVHPTFSDKNFGINSSIGNKKWTEHDRTLRSQFLIRDLLIEYKTSTTVTNETYSNSHSYSETVAKVQMKLADDAVHKCIYAVFNSYLQNNNLWYPATNSIQL